MRASWGLGMGLVWSVGMGWKAPTLAVVLWVIALTVWAAVVVGLL